ncbi:MAG: hypothetical protein KME21_00415 [Desmonostoc vinosum HA7617-LM4]|nr:hypothetical protein [Desmonostoc vinosum HA7617-LM4]
MVPKLESIYTELGIGKRTWGHGDAGTRRKFLPHLLVSEFRLLLSETLRERSTNAKSNHIVGW